MYKYSIILLLICLAISSCKDTTTSGTDGSRMIVTADTKDTSFEIVNPTLTTVSDEVKASQSHAASLVESRSTNEGTYSMIVSDYWWFQFVFDGRKMSKAEDFQGYWLNFKDDFSFEYGIYDQIYGTGKYHFTLDTKKLIMVEDNPDKMPMEWELLTKEDVMVMVGSDYFGNNPRQMKMERFNELPVKTS